MRFLTAVGLAVCALAFIPAPAAAVPVVCSELGDAGALPGTAADCLGAIDEIQGQFGGGNPHADVYRIYIAPGGGFSATTVGGAGFDTQLFLFDSAGMGVAANDDSAGLQATLPLNHALLSGLSGGFYYLALSRFDNDPVSAGGLIFPSAPFGGVYGPTAAGGLSPVTGWSSNADGGGQYTIFLTGTADPIPEPGTLLLLGGGLMGLAMRRRRTR